MCPVLISLAYLADRGYITFGIEREEKETPRPLLDNASKDELAEIEFQIKKEHGQHLTEEQILGFMKAQYVVRHTKAYYAKAGKVRGSSGAVASMLPIIPEPLSVRQATFTSDDSEAELAKRVIRIGFLTPAYACLESSQVAKLKVVRKGPQEPKVSVKFNTVAGTATEGTDFEAISGELVFEEGDTEKELRINIMNDNAYEEDEEFYVQLSEAQVIGDDSNTMSNMRAELAEGHEKATVTIIDDDLPGKIRFKSETMNVEVKEEDFEVAVTVERYDGSSGIIACKYHTEDFKDANEGEDYEKATGKIKMYEHEMSAQIMVPIKASGRYNQEAKFNVVLTDPHCIGTDGKRIPKEGTCTFDKKTDGGEDSCICCISIKGEASEKRDNHFKRLATRIQGSKKARNMYLDQFKDALFKIVDEYDEDYEDDDEDLGPAPKNEEEKEDERAPTWVETIMHIINLPWKLLFALVPPPAYCDGWLTFFGSLLFIALITALVGDMANLFGCSLGLPAEITAITCVALGTSLPDTFASKTAAEMDPFADNSIGNITGSNSVNVFIGLGLSWSLAALWWESTPADKNLIAQAHAGLYTGDDPWLSKFSGYDKGVRENVLKQMGDGDNLTFIVPAGSLGLNLLFFTINAFFAIQHLFARRKKFGGELGGPKRGFMGQYFSGAFLVFQWVIYITASSVVAIMYA
jgi:solute carrier family 8 (sodium/calcium exchanger)